MSGRLWKSWGRLSSWLLGMQGSVLGVGLRLWKGLFVGLLCIFVMVRVAKEGRSEQLNE